MILCTVFMFQLQQEELPFWRTMLAYCEFAIIGCLGVVYFAITVMAPFAGATGSCPAWPYSLMTFSGFALALFVIYHRSSPWKRLLVHLIWIPLFVLFVWQIEKVTDAMKWANHYVAEGDIPMAANALESRLSTKPDDFNMSALAMILRSHAGQLDDFKRLRRRFVDTHNTRGNAGGVFWVIRLALLLPIDDDFTRQAIYLAKVSEKIQYSDHEFVVQQQYWRGLAALRGDDWKVANELFSTVGADEAANEYLRAMPCVTIRHCRPSWRSCGRR